MPREIRTLTTSCNVEAVTLPDDLTAWLAAHAHTHGLCWLIAHTDSGVIWGERRADGLALSCDVYPRPGLRLHPTTLQQARLFGEQGELLLWRGANKQWQTTLRRDGQGEPSECFDEAYMLWGYHEERPAANGFREIREGSEGIIHAPPLLHIPKEKQRAKLSMRHYLDYDASGMVRITASRFVSLHEAKV